MYVVEIVLPVFNADGQAYAKSRFEHVRNGLTEKFGGVTAFQRTPAIGLWKDDVGEVRRDDIAIFEVMTPALDKKWWSAYRRQLEINFGQQSVVVRASNVEVL